MGYYALKGIDNPDIVSKIAADFDLEGPRHGNIKIWDGGPFSSILLIKYNPNDDISLMIQTHPNGQETQETRNLVRRLLFLSGSKELFDGMRKPLEIDPYKPDVFDPRIIEEFCSSIGDNNKLHDPEYLDVPVVPGMAVFAKAASTHVKKYNTIDVYFDDMLLAGQGSVIYSKNTGELYSSDAQNKNTLKGSRVYSSDKTLKNIEGILRELTPKDVDTFARSVGVSEPDILYSISYASSALMQMLNSPESEQEKELASEMDGKLPAFKSMKVFLTGDVDLKRPLKYQIMPEKTAKSEYRFTVNCSQDSLIYQAEFEIKAMPATFVEKVIMRKAKKLNLYNFQDSMSQ